MKQNKTFKPYKKLPYLIVLGLGFTFVQTSQASDFFVSKTILQQDSIGNEVINGQRFLIHKLSPQQTYYQLGRIYNLPVKDIMEANKSKNLRVGDSIKIPRGKAIAASSPEKKENNGKVLINPQDITEYKVGKSETLYAISKRFDISVDDIKKVNNLSSNTVREGQILKIPNASLPQAPAEPPLVQLPEIVEEHQPIDDSMFKTNKYGIRENKERGIGVWMSNLSDDNNTSFALHKSAPIGTILKITNPMNRSVTFAKVVGKFGDNEETQGAIVVLSKSVASSIGALDKRFQIEITYGVPLEN